MDIVLMERVWARLVKEMNIPVGIEPPPMIFDSSYPSDVNMAFVYSIMPEYIVPSHIAVSPRAINKKNLSADHFIWGIGHELTHFAFVMRDNGWKYAPYYVEKTKHHHCNREFQRITKALADEIWDAHHDDTMRAFLYGEVILVCEYSPD